MLYHFRFYLIREDLDNNVAAIQNSVHNSGLFSYSRVKARIKARISFQSKFILFKLRSFKYM